MIYLIQVLIGRIAQSQPDSRLLAMSNEALISNHVYSHQTSFQLFHLFIHMYV